MSYILEALKKAQAERQLGSAPTIHAVPIHAPASAGRGAGRAAPWIGAAAVAALGLAGWWWRTPPAAPQLAVLTPATPQAAVPAPALAQPPSAAPPVAVQPAPAMPAPPAGLAPAGAPVAAPLAPRAPVKPPVFAARIAPAPASTPAATPVTPPLPTAAPVKAPAPAVARASEEPPVPALRELPEVVQRGLPTVTFGGYMYSANPADRLLLVDKVLRHEGEEVAPGLILEKLLPKEAVMNYRGSRYRMAY